MHLDLSTLFEFLFPKSDDEKLLETIPVLSFVSKLHPTIVSNTICLTSFKDPYIRAAMHLAKFHNHAHATKLLATLLTQWLQHKYQSKEVLLLPIPLSKKRYRQRGYNQVANIIKRCELPQNNKYTPLLVRTKDTKPQTSLSKNQRLTNLIGAFAVAKGKEQALAGKHILIVDDVTTTGATLRAAETALASYSPASVTCVALAH